MKNFEIEQKNIEDDEKPKFKASEIPEVQKKYILITICAMAFLDFAGYGLPITLYPQISAARGWSSTLTGIVLGLFPFGGFFTSCLTGKIMRYYKKDNLLLLFLIITCISKFLFGCVYFIDDSYGFMILSIVTRLLWGFAFTAYQTVSISIIPETWPDSIILKLSYYELFLNCGLVSGPLIGSVIAYFWDFFWVFTLFSTFHFVIGIWSIFTFFKIDAIAQFMENKPSLSLKKIVKDSTLMIQFFFQCLFLGSVMWVSSDLENHVIADLGGTQTTCAIIYCLNMAGIFFALLFINKVFQVNVVRKKWFLTSSILIIIFNNLFGPASFLGIDDKTTALWLMAFAFFMVGISQGMIAVLMVPEYRDLLKLVFPYEPEELLVDMAPALYLASYSFAECVNVIVGGIVIDEIGYNWTSVIYSGILIVYFIIYWGKQLLLLNENNKMVEESDEELDDG